MTTERLEVERAIAAEPSAIFNVLSDPKGHVAIDASGMLMDASGDPVRAVDDTFVVHMDREALNDYPLGLYDVTVRIVTFDQDREIAWTPEGQLNLGHVYGYRLEPIEGGTLVTSYYDWSTVEQSWKDAAIFPIIPETGLRATPGILARPGGTRASPPRRVGHKRVLSSASESSRCAGSDSTPRPLTGLGSSCVERCDSDPTAGAEEQARLPLRHPGARPGRRAAGDAA